MAELALSKRQELAQLLAERQRRLSRRKIWTYFPDTGPLSRSNYPQHMEFFRLGAENKTRCFMAANRVGKTESGGGFEMVLHLTGQYPDWWEGYRFDRPIDAWAAGDTNETVRDIIQNKLMGPREELGTGLIPGDCIHNFKYRPNSNGSMDYVLVKHVSGKLSRLAFKSYEQGRKAFQGTEKDIIWLDEESNEGIRAECIMRLMTTSGHLIETFTPLKGLTPVVLSYLGEDGLEEAKVDRHYKKNGKAMVMAGWDDAPHLGAEEKRRMLGECEAHLVESRSKGIPSLGAGAIYPLNEEDFLCDPFLIPEHWPRAYGMDVGWNRTAAVWGALDRDSNVLYLYSEHYRGKAEPSVHASNIKARGAWIPGAIDPAARGSAQKDGEQLMEVYRDQGLRLTLADNGREAGIHRVYEGLSVGTIKVFRTLQNWRAERRIYRRDENGKVVKENDHLMDATRYLAMTGVDLAKTKPIKRGVTKPRNWKTT